MYIYIYYTSVYPCIKYTFGKNGNGHIGLEWMHFHGGTHAEVTEPSSASLTALGERIRSSSKAKSHTWLYNAPARLL